MIYGDLTLLYAAGKYCQDYYLVYKTKRVPDAEISAEPAASPCRQDTVTASEPA